MFGATRGLLYQEQRPLTRQVAHEAGFWSGPHGAVMSRRYVTEPLPGGLFWGSWPTHAIHERPMAFPPKNALPGGMGGTQMTRPPTRRDVEMHLGRYTFHNRNWVACTTYAFLAEIEGSCAWNEYQSHAYSLTEMDSVVISVACRHAYWACGCS